MLNGDDCIQVIEGDMGVLDAPNLSSQQHPYQRQSDYLSWHLLDTHMADGRPRRPQQIYDDDHKICLGTSNSPIIAKLFKSD